MPENRLTQGVFLLIGGIALTYIIVQAQFLLSPLLFGAFLALMTLPLCRFYERFIPWRGVAIAFSFITITLPVLGIAFLFGMQIVDVFQNLDQIGSKIESGLSELFQWGQGTFGFTKDDGIHWLQQNVFTLMDTPVQMAQKGITTGTQLAFGLFLVFFSAFFFLLYRSAYRNFLLQQTQPDKREDSIQIMGQIQKVVRQYLYGLATVILILAVLNSIGLWLIGLDYPIFWACLAALLTIIPYIGTAIGGMLPFLYCMATYEYWWQPLAVVLLYAAVQQLEGNLITPNVVGRSVKINPLVALVAVIIGGMMWGVAGIFLALPIAAIIRISLDHHASLKPFGHLMSDSLRNEEKKFLNEWDKDEFRF
jgi:predicted PurR-regulated permease PerM